MSYYDVAVLASDGDFSTRTMACVAGQSEIAESPSAWWSTHAWDMAAAPGFGDAYASALANEVPNPGRDPAVISDAQILSAVQAITSQGGE